MGPPSPVFGVLGVGWDLWKGGGGVCVSEKKGVLEWWWSGEREEGGGVWGWRSGMVRGVVRVYTRTTLTQPFHHFLVKHPTSPIKHTASTKKNKKKTKHTHT